MPFFDGEGRLFVYKNNIVLLKVTEESRNRCPRLEPPPSLPQGEETFYESQLGSVFSIGDSTTKRVFRGYIYLSEGQMGNCQHLWYLLFQALRHTVSGFETHGFKLWDTQFQALRHTVSGSETHSLRLWNIQSQCKTSLLYVGIISYTARYNGLSHRW